MASPQERLSRAWPHLRAALVTAHCVAVALVAIPVPFGRNHAIGLDDPRFAVEVHPWAAFFGMSDESFAHTEDVVRERTIAVRDRVAAPFERYLELAGAEQHWNMFSSPNATPVSFLLDVAPPGAVDESRWTFLAGLPPGTWRRSFFESERTRSLLEQGARWQDWGLVDDFCRYVAAAALREDPSRGHARCRVTTARVPSWREPSAPLPEPHLEHTLEVDPAP